MKAFLIDAYEQTIATIEFDGSLAGVRAAIGYDTIESDEINDHDRLFFDEECFIRQQPQPGRFKLGSLPPVAGRGLVIGGGPEEAGLTEPSLSLDELRTQVQFG